MTSPLSPNAAHSLPQAITDHLEHDGFTFLPAKQSRAWLEAYGLKDWDSFAASWNHLGVDRYMADGGRYRRRRYGTFSITNGTITRKQHQPHYQSRDYNLLNGGVERWFSPITDEIGQHSALLAILQASSHMADTLTPMKTPQPLGMLRFINSVLKPPPKVPGTQRQRECIAMVSTGSLSSWSIARIFVKV